MICLQEVKRYCHEYWKIENYEEAVKDENRTWHCLHRSETTYKGRKINEYYNVHYSELIFLSPDEVIKQKIEMNKKRWADPEWRAWANQQRENARLYGKKKKVKKTKEEKFESYSKAAKKRWADPAIRQKNIDNVRKALKNCYREITPEMREHYRQGAKKRLEKYGPPRPKRKYKVCPLMLYYYRVECKLKWDDVGEKLNVPSLIAWNRAIDFHIPDTPIFGEEISARHEIISRGAKNRRQK